MTFKDLRF